MMKLRPLLISAASLIVFLSGASPASAASYNWQNLPTKPVLNQIVNNPKIGNEKQFLTIRYLSAATGQRQLNVQPGQELALTAYFDNAASKSSQAAKNVRIRFSVPSAQTTNFKITATLSADNTEPKSLADSVTVTSPQPVKLAVERGTTRLWNNVWRGQPVADTAYTTGAVLGYDELDGRVPGGPAYSGYVTLKLKVLGPPSGSVPNTGPGDMVGLFVGASAVGAAYHLVRTSRRRA